MTVAELIFVWGMSAIVLLIPTGLVVMWALCRTPTQAQTAPKAADLDPPPPVPRSL